MKRTLISIIGLAIFIHYYLRKRGQSFRQSEYEPYFDPREYGMASSRWNGM